MHHFICLLLFFQNEAALIKSQQLSQSVKAVCLTLCKIETMEITKTLGRVENIVAQLKVCLIEAFGGMVSARSSMVFKKLSNYFQFT